MNKQYVFVVMIACSTIYAANDESFIVKQPEKKVTVSKNKLKEKIASSLKDALDAIKKLSEQEKACSGFVHENKSKKNAFVAQAKNHCQAWHSELSLINSRLACNDCLR